MSRVALGTVGRPSLGSDRAEGRSPTVSFALPVELRRPLQRLANQRSGNGRGDLAAVVRDALTEMLMWPTRMTARPEAKGARFSVTVSWPMYNALEVYAADAGRTVPGVVTSGVAHYLDACARDNALIGLADPTVRVLTGPQR